MLPPNLFKIIQTALLSCDFKLCNAKNQVFKNQKFYLRLGNYRKYVGLIEVIACPIKYFDKWSNSSMFKFLVILDKETNPYIMFNNISIHIEDIKTLCNVIPVKFLERHCFEIKI